MSWKEKLSTLGACTPGMAAIDQSHDREAFWSGLEKGDWLLWLLYRTQRAKKGGKYIACLLEIAQKCEDSRVSFLLSATLDTLEGIITEPDLLLILSKELGAKISIGPSRAVRFSLESICAKLCKDTDHRKAIAVIVRKHYPEMPL